MAESENTTFICPACGEAELPLPENMNPNETPYTQLSELHDCDRSKAARFIHGNAHSRGFGGTIREKLEDGATRERWVPPRAVVAFHFYRNQVYLAREESAAGFFPQPLYRNRMIIEGEENVFVAMTFLPHGEIPTDEMRARGEAMAKAMK
ncbi:MAG TPA: hypothetical protein DDZ83_10050 [Nitrospinae bacterium]|nr:hypothetical protein [Nitrospinota bacterium]